MKFIKVDPRFESLPNESEFQEILRGRNLIPLVKRPGIYLFDIFDAQLSRWLAPLE